MTDFWEIFGLVFLTGLLSFGGFFLIKAKLYPVGFLCTVLFFASLKTTFDLVSSMIIGSITLLEINATIVAGAIILLTITSFVSPTGHESIRIPTGRKNHYFALTPHQVASGTIVGFGGSAIIILLDNSSNASSLSMVFAISGFVYLVFCAIVIAFKEQFDQESTGDVKN